MYPGCSARLTLAMLTSEPIYHVCENTDLEHHLTEGARNAATGAAWYLRLLPSGLRQSVQQRLIDRQRARQLIRLWETSPHLLSDAGYVLSDSAELPGHLIAAPEAVIAHVAARDPGQIVAAEAAYPPRRLVLRNAAKEQRRAIPVLPALITN